MTKQPEPVTLFLSYAHKDEVLRCELEVHLSGLRREGLISTWHDRQIVPGTEWAQVIDTHLEAASIILLLVSADFLASDYCYDIEMQRALERHRHGEASVIPIILRPCDWQHSPFAHLQCLPRNSKPITDWDSQDQAFLSIVQGLRQMIAQQQFLARPLSSLQRQNRQQLLKRIRETWIEGLLEHSLYQAAWMDLRLQEQPDALENPWLLQVQELDHEPHPLPAGTSIIDVYDEADGELLILGEPGSGKTTLLLQLTRTLLDRALADERERLPIVFNLSSWAIKRQPLAEWLVEELNTKYRVPRKVGKSWVDTNQVLPLLDGLDEVAKEHRAECVDAINAYRQMHDGVNPLVVCSRTAEYFGQSKKVLVRKGSPHTAVDGTTDQ